MITYNSLIQETLSTLGDQEKSQDIILSYGQQYKKIEESDILINQKELLTFPLWNSNSEFIPTTSAVTIDLSGSGVNPSIIQWQFKYAFTNENPTSSFFGAHPFEKRHFLSQSLGYVINPNTANTDTNHDDILFYFGYANYDGSGSVQNSIINANAPIEILNSTPSKILYRAIRNQILETNDKFKLDNFSEINDFFYIKIPRNVYREKIRKNSLSLTLKFGAVSLKLTDDSLVNKAVVDNNTIVPIVSGTLNNVYTSSQVISGVTYSNKHYYGLMDTDNAYLILSAKTIFDYISGSGANTTQLYSTSSNFVSSSTFTYEGRIEGEGSTTLTFYRNLRGFTQLLYGGCLESSFKLSGLETYTYDTYYITVGANDFNRSTNPSYLTGSRGDTFKESLTNDDFVYITSIGLYNDAGDLLAIGKLSKPILKKRGDVKLFRINISI